MSKPQPASPLSAAADITPHATITAFIALLEREQQLLAQPPADALEAIAAQKQALLDQLHAQGLSAQTARKEPALRALVARAQQLNAVNARLLAVHRASCESRLQPLRGGPSANALYRANGYLGA